MRIADFKAVNKIADPNAKQKAVIHSNYQDLQGLKHLYVWGDPGSGKSMMVDMLYETLSVGKRK